jgi:hypothetical protein
LCVELRNIRAARLLQPLTFHFDDETHPTRHRDCQRLLGAHTAEPGR